MLSESHLLLAGATLAVVVLVLGFFTSASAPLAYGLGLTCAVVVAAASYGRSLKSFLPPQRKIRSDE